MSKYTEVLTVASITFRPQEWDNFLERIQSNCNFVKTETIPRYPALPYILSHKRDITLRSYKNGPTTYFHVSNDDRRKIVKFLRTQGDLPP